ncbi:MAG: helix-turn-helix domain-containing protein [Deltaproteobacteria bacterium]|nr:helix-turn-helix domain-containing protein [Deltaproteobacteria bacterium]
MALLRPSELARLWELHPKTVYLWIREGKLPAIKTPGAQYRVRSDDARAYCEKNGLPMPRALASPAGTVAVVGKPGPSQRALARACKARGTSVVSWSSVLDGLLAIAGEPPDAVAIDGELADIRVVDVVRALKKSPKTAGVPILVYDAPGRAGALLKAGAAQVVTRGRPEDTARAIVDLLDASETP